MNWSLILIPLLISISIYLFFDSSSSFDTAELSENLQKWKASGRYFLFRTATGENVNIFYVNRIGKREGNEKPRTLLLLHGFPSSSYDYYKIWGGLEKEFDRLVTFDLLGFGFSDKPFEHRYSIHEQANITEALLQHLNISHFHILTHDYGVSVAQELLARDFDENRLKPMIQSVTFLNGGLFPDIHRPRLLQTLLLNSWIGPLISNIITPSSFKRSLSEVFGPNTQPSEEEFEEFWAITHYHNGNLISHRLIYYIKDRLENAQRWVNSLHDAAKRIPVQFINGPFDPACGLHMVQRCKEIVTEKNVVVLNSTIGHYPQIEDPDAVLNAYLSFLRSQS